MELKFLKYFDNISHIYCFATILDPRKKLDGLQTALEGIGDLLDMDYLDAFNHVKDKLFRVLAFTITNMLKVMLREQWMNMT